MLSYEFLSGSYPHNRAPRRGPQDGLSAIRSSNHGVEELFGVKVAKVNTIKLPGKWKRMGVHVGKRPDIKKAVVTLTADSKKIEIFENMM